MFDLLAPRTRFIDPPSLPDRIHPRVPSPDVPTPTGAAMLDEVDYPVLLVDRRFMPLFANRAARAMLEAGHPLCLRDGRLRPAAGIDALPLEQAVERAGHGRLRALVTLQDEGRGGCTAASVIPVDLPGAGACAMVMLSRSRMCEDLTLQCYARHHGLTAGETRVLQALCAGRPVAGIARDHGVALSTIRTQIAALRAKTGAHDLRSLMCAMAMLPPLVGVLRPAAAAPAAA